MKLLLVSDIHANWPALRASRKDADPGNLELGLAKEMARALTTIPRRGKAFPGPGSEGAGGRIH